MNTLENLLPDHLREDLSLAERKLLQCLPLGEIADFRAGEEAEDNPEQWSSWGPERIIRADLLAYLCSSQQVHAWVHPKGLQVKGARIQGMLDLEGATIPFGLSLQHGAIPDGLILSNARIGRLALDGSYLGPVTGDNMVIEGPMLLEQVRVRGQIQFETMRVGGNLGCTGGHFENPGGYALDFDGASIKGHVFLDEGFQAKGQVHLIGADIGGQLICRGGYFENPGGIALTFSGASIKGHVFLDTRFHTKGEDPNTRFHTKGEVRLIDANLGGLTCTGGYFENPGGIALTFNRATVTGGVFLDEGFHAKGTMALGYAKVGTLVDDPHSWPAQDALVIEGFEYTAFAGHAPATAEERLKWLRLQPHERFVPQTYDQLAIVFRRMGLEADATRVMIAKQKDLILYGQLTW
jgi:hypothetical protein